MKKYLAILVLGIVVIPQVALAAWWNPFSWHVWGLFISPVTNNEQVVKVESSEETKASTKEDLQVESLRNEIEDLKKTVKGETPTGKQENLSALQIKNANTVNNKTSSTITKKLTNSEIISKVKPAVVYIKAATSAGTGMIFTTDGYILTNAHVVNGLSVVEISTINGVSYKGKVVGVNTVLDLAVIKIAVDTILPTVVFGDSSEVMQGDEVFTLGFPFGISGDVSFKEGTISRRIGGNLEISAEIHPGNSGGPLVNQFGKVIGINSSTYGASVNGIHVGEVIKFAIPINLAKENIESLKSGYNDISVAVKTEKVTIEPQTLEQKAYWEKWVVINNGISEGQSNQNISLELIRSGAVSTSGLYIQKASKSFNESMELINSGYIPENRRAHLHLKTALEFLIHANDELQKNYEFGQKVEYYTNAISDIDKYMYYKTLSDENLKRF